MILSCPECRTRYVVPDSAVGPTGRQVRCAACRHSWFQEGAPIDLIEPPAVNTSELPELPESTALVAPLVSAPRVEPVNEPEAVDDERYDAFAHEPPFQPRRNPARRLTIIAVAIAALLIGGIGAIQYFGTPPVLSSALARLGLPGGVVDIPLLLEVPRKPERRELPSGNEIFALSGRVVNPTDEPQRVPDIMAELRDAQGRVVYGWTITPPRRTLAAHGTMPFDSAEVDVPKGSKNLNLSFSGAVAK